jgi:hypothetical protein
MSDAPHSSPSGFTFTLRPASRVSERLRRPVAAKLVELSRSFVTEEGGLAPADLILGDELNDLLAVALLVEWSAPAPISLDAFLDLPKEDYDAIRQAVAPLATEMIPDFGPTPEAGTPSTP